MSKQSKHTSQKKVKSKKNEAQKHLIRVSDFVAKSGYLPLKIIVAVVFVVVACYLTAICNDFLLLKIEQLSLFQFTATFFVECMQSAGGLLVYVGTFLTQFFYYPWVGAVIFICLLLCVQYLTFKVFRISDGCFALSFIPSLMLLLALTQLDYVIYVIKSPGYVYVNVLGVIVAECCFAVYKNIKTVGWRIAYFLLWILLTYPLFGFYTLWGVLICVVYELGLFVADRKTNHWICLFVTLFMGLLIPYIYSVRVYNLMPYANRYIATLPDFAFTASEICWWIPFIISFLCLLLFSIFVVRQPETHLAQWKVIGAFMSYLLAVVFVCNLSYKNENFRTEVKMEMAIADKDWRKVLRCANDLQGEPTRLGVVYTNLALYKLRMAGDRMFTYKQSSCPYKMRRTFSALRQMGARPLFLNYGHVNYCYRWCMEDMVEYGKKVEYMKYMVECALLNKEFDLAQKYNNVLWKTLFHRDCAAKYQAYIDNPDKMAANADFKSIYPLMQMPGQLSGDDGLIEVYLLNMYGQLHGGNAELVELAILSNLIVRNIEHFWPMFFIYVRHNERIPIHYQEAALLYSYLEHKVSLQGINIDKAVSDRFDRMIQISQQNPQLSEEQLGAFLKPQYENTFWYYYFFVKDVKTD